ncbi:MAG: aldehyde dehydrogenase family protein [Acidimicrobiia bacterium]
MTERRIGDERLLIGGDLRPAEGGRTFENIDPTTEQPIGLAPDASVEDASAAIAAARAAFDRGIWRDDLDQRIHCLEQFRAAIVRNSDELREVLIQEAGCPSSFTKGMQLDGVPTFIDEAIEVARSYAWETHTAAYAGGPAGVLRREPRGVVAAITAFNYPLLLNIRKAAPALAAGCTVVIKPSPETPWSATVLGRIIAEETDFPAGVLNVVTSADVEVATLLTTDPRVDMVAFVGSSAVGKAIMAQGADTLKKVVLELGGKSAMVICDDADVATAARTAAGVGLHAGQGCSRLTRFLVQRSRYDEALEAAVDAFSQIVVGDPRDEDVVQGPQISSRQQKRVLELIDGATQEGARRLFGGGVPAALPRGYFVQPTLFADVDPDSTIAQTEVFGPVAVMIPFDTDDEAVAIANNSRYGLSGAVVSGDVERAMGIARRMRTGEVAVNGARPGNNLPFGGWKDSGVGVDSGVMGFEEHLEAKALGIPG